MVFKLGMVVDLGMTYNMIYALACFDDLDLDARSLSSSSKLNLCKGGNFLPMIFKVTLSEVFTTFCVLYLCPFIALSKATSDEISHIVLSSPY